MENTINNDKAMRLLQEAHRQWERLGALRQKRERNKCYTYGNQWCDLMTDEQGRQISERDYLRESGKEPLSNNLIRQLVKSVVGRFRNSLKDGDGEPDVPFLRELDSRLMEEFLISGCCFQRIDFGEADGIAVDNVSPARMFFRGGDDPRCEDFDIIGQLHDLPLQDLVSRLCDGSRLRALDICRHYQQPYDTLAPSSPDFFLPSVPGRVRAIELWRRESREGYDCHNPATGEWYFEPGSPVADIAADGVERRWVLHHVWRCYWLSPDGAVLSQYDSPYAHGDHPFVAKLYPLTDGEVHSMVEDVIDQQKYVNRLITLVDHVMGASAKGVLLYLDNILPEGYTWQDLRYAWAKPNGIVPYHPRGGNDRPEQISGNATNIGAYEMVNLQMRLFEQISGVSGALQGQAADAFTGAQLYESQVANSSIALSDIFDTFNGFRHSRDQKISALRSMRKKIIE